MNTMCIEYSGMRPIVQEAVTKANKLLQDEQFYDNIMKHSHFELANISPAEIAKLMRTAGIKMEVELYYAVSPVKNIDLYDDDNNPNLIHMNIWKLERPVSSICNTLLHSCVHAVNSVYNRHYFGHGDTTLPGKEQTAPYMIGAIAQNMVSGGMEDIIPFEHDMMVPGSIIIKDHLKLYE